MGEVCAGAYFGNDLIFVRNVRATRVAGVVLVTVAVAQVKYSHDLPSKLVLCG